LSVADVTITWSERWGAWVRARGGGERRRRREGGALAAGHLEVAPPRGDFLEDAEEHVGVQGALVRLVHDKRGVVVEVCLAQGLTQQHAVRHVLDDGLGRGAVLEADGVAHLVAQLHLHLLRHALPSGGGA